MALVTMTTASFLGAATLSGRSPATIATHRRSLVIRNSSAKNSESVKIISQEESKNESSSGRRDLVFAAAVGAVCAVAGVAVAEEPKRGTPMARKIYAPVCVTMPTAKICHK
ncbi:hypothetical protein Vadar_023350 [Vaccinium darrowii]|uniref:Uncharacterized protein n=1 Tax=Vaccinium darrowii TaxID=229202 RepID=A0ACB7Y8S3_9ERIC|nr:hypothetical protein Vadar_023350 [Vaccinium darrowii]